MTELQKKLDSAYQMLGKLPVTGDGVDVMFFVRQELREAYKLAGEAESEATADG